MLTPLVKYPGGKEKELKHILPNLPKKIANYYEPFVGGGAVYFAISEKVTFFLPIMSSYEVYCMLLL